MTVTTYRGYKTVVVYGDETSYGAGAVPATVIKGKIQTLTLNKNNTLNRMVGLGEGRNETFVGWGNFEGSWSMEYEVAAFDFLRYGIGAMAGAGSTASPYHLEEKDFMDYDAGSDHGLKSFGLTINSLAATTNDKEVLSGCIINNIGLSLNVGETLKCSLEGFFKTVTNETTTTAYTADTTKPWIFAQGNFKWNNVAVARVTSATINIANNFDPEVGRQIGSRFVEAGEPGLRKYDWVLTVKMTSAVATSLRDDFYGIDNTPHTGVKSAEPTFYEISFEFAEGTASADRNARILLENCAVNDISKPINIGENIVEVTINGTAKAGLTDGTEKRPIKWWSVTA